MVRPFLCQFSPSLSFRPSLSSYSFTMQDRAFCFFFMFSHIFSQYGCHPQPLRQHAVYANDQSFMLKVEWDLSLSLSLSTHTHTHIHTFGLKIYWRKGIFISGLIFKSELLHLISMQCNKSMDYERRVRWSVCVCVCTCACVRVCVCVCEWDGGRWLEV